MFWHLYGLAGDWVMSLASFDLFDLEGSEPAELSFAAVGDVVDNVVEETLDEFAGQSGGDFEFFG